MHQFQAELATISSQTGTDPVTASIGVAYVPNGSGVTPEQLYVRADELLYLCKGQGRNQFQIEQANEPGERSSDIQGLLS